MLSSCSNDERDTLYNVPIHVTSVTTVDKTNTYQYRIDGEQRWSSDGNNLYTHRVSLHTMCDTFKVNDTIYPSW